MKLTHALVLATGLSLAFAPSHFVRAQDDGDDSADPAPAASPDTTDFNADSTMDGADPNAALAEPNAFSDPSASASPDANAFSDPQANAGNGGFQLASNDGEPVVCWPGVDDETGFPVEECSDGKGPLGPDDRATPEPQPSGPSWWDRFKSLFG